MSITQLIERSIVFYTALLIAFAVFAYGLTTEETRNLFDLLLLGAVGGWIALLISLRRMPAVRRFALAIPGFLLVIGWVSILNAGFDHDWDTGFEKLRDPIPWLPSTLNHTRSLNDMKHLTILVFGGWMISDLCRDRRNRQTLLFALVITGLAFSLVGIFQKAAGSRSLLFSEKEYPGDVMTFFASYRYHGNAATLLNYCWPLAAALLLADFLKKEKYWRIAVLACATLFTLSALFINTSKFGHATTPFLLLVFVVLYFRPLKKVTRGVPHRRVMLVVAGTVLVALMMALAAISFSDSVEKWGGAEARNNMLNRDYESDSKLYESLLDKLKVANVEREYKPSEIAVLEPPVLPPGPRYVNKASYYLKYGAVSLGLGLGLALFLGSMDTRIRRVEDLERLANTQVLTAVPKSSKLAKGMADKTNSAEYEAFRTLHTNNILAVPESKVILVTSSTPKEG